MAPDISHLHDGEMREKHSRKILGSAVQCACGRASSTLFHFMWHRGEGSTQNHAKLFRPPSVVLHCSTVTV
jgi:hypothetical protein